VLRWRGAGPRRPLLLVAHLDVVVAKREDWSVDPFTLLEKGGFFYGRGTSDDKAMASQFVANLIRLREEGFVSDRDLILALTADKEGDNFNGVDWLVKNHKDLIDADFATGCGGRVTLVHRAAPNPPVSDCLSSCDSDETAIVRVPLCKIKPLGTSAQSPVIVPPSIRPWKTLVNLTPR
jgi:hypothetical protein